MPLLTIVFPIHDGLDHTQQCLHSLYNGAQIDALPEKIEVVIADDGSKDGSAEWIKTHYPQVHLVEGNGDLWWSGGINLCIDYAIKQLKTQYILWWNNDIVPEHDYFSNLINTLRQKEEKTIIGSKIYMAHDRATIWSMGGIFDPQTGFKDMIGACRKDGIEYQEKKYADWLPGMGTVTHISVYDKLGFIDDQNFPQYHGDSDFTFRAKKNGYQIVVYPELKIFNDSKNTGLKHDESLRKLIQSLVSIKSNYNIKKDFLFYRLHARSMIAYKVLFLKYYRYIGGFFKWKILGFFGIHRG